MLGEEGRVVEGLRDLARAPQRGGRRRGVSARARARRRHEPALRGPPPSSSPGTCRSRTCRAIIVEARPVLPARADRGGGRARRARERRADGARGSRVQAWEAAVASRMRASPTTVPGRAMSAIRLERLTVCPNQSPPRVTAGPNAAPAWTGGRSSASARPRRRGGRRVSSRAAGSDDTSIAASPRYLTARAGGTSAAAVRVASLAAIRPTSSGGTRAPIRVKPERSAKATATSCDAGAAAGRDWCG